MPIWNERYSRSAEILFIAAGVFLITILHYATSAAIFPAHDLYRRLYYIPIIIAAFRFGIWGGLYASALTSILYAPHAFLAVPNIDPQSTANKLLEIVLYNVIALVTGYLVERLRAEAREHRETAGNLQRTLKQVESIQYRLRVTERLAAIGQLTAGLAHELRNPLGSIQGAAEIISDDFPPGHPKHEMVDVLLKESARLNETLSRFLDFAKPHELQIEECDIGREIETVVELLRHSSRWSKHKIEYQNLLEGRTVPADRNMLRQVILNLSLNALEAMPDGGALKLAAGERREDGGSMIAISFVDDGEGIAKDKLEKIFNPFFTTKPGGTGLGLAVTHRIVEDHGGALEIDSEPGRGTRVTVLIPAERKDEAPDTDS